MIPFIGSPDDAVHDDDILTDPYAGDPLSRSKDSECDRMLALLDSLDELKSQRGNG